MLLSDRSIKEFIYSGELVIDPFAAPRLQPASYDLTLGDNIKRVSGSTVPVRPGKTDGLTSGHWENEWLNLGGGSLLAPGEFALVQTAEEVYVPPFLAAKLEGKSTLGRWGLVVHVTAGFVDPGFRGPLTLELHNVAPWPIELVPGDPISQIAFQMLTSPAESPYMGRYQLQRGVQPGLSRP